MSEEFDPTGAYGRQRCTARRKSRTDWQCPRWAMKGGDRCRRHGGARPGARKTITVDITGSAVDEASLRRLIEEHMVRLGRRNEGQ